MRVRVEAEKLTLTLECGDRVGLKVRGEDVVVTPREPVVVRLDGHGDRIPGLPRPWGTEGVRRTDGSVITASVSIRPLASSTAQYEVNPTSSANSTTNSP